MVNYDDDMKLSILHYTQKEGNNIGYINNYFVD